MFQNVLTKIVGKKSDRELKRLRQLVAEVGTLEPELKELEDPELAGRIALLRNRAQNGEPLDELMPEVFAVCREGARRTLAGRIALLRNRGKARGARWGCATSTCSSSAAPSCTAAASPK